MALPIIAVVEALPALVKLGDAFASWYGKDRRKALRQLWAELIDSATKLSKTLATVQDRAERNRLTQQQADKATEIRQYLADRILDAERTPIYEWVVFIDVPLGLITDCVDLLIEGRSVQSGRGLFWGLFGGSPDAQREEWSRTVKLTLPDGTPDREAIVRAFAKNVSRAGRAAYYCTKNDTLAVDIGMLADLGEIVSG